MGLYIALAIFIIAIIYFSKPIGKLIEKALAGEWNSMIDEIAEEFKMKDEE